jgi:hypothetical protein
MDLLFNHLAYQQKTEKIITNDEKSLEVLAPVLSLAILQPKTGVARLFCLLA